MYPHAHLTRDMCIPSNMAVVFCVSLKNQGGSHITRDIGSLTFRGKVYEVNEGKFVLNIDFIMALKPDGLCVYETTKQDSI